MSDWLDYLPTSGFGNSTFVITASTETELEDRVATIIARNDSYSLSASTDVIQKGIPPTSITFDSLTAAWVTDVPASGGTATKDNCTYKVYANYGDGLQMDVTRYATVSGSLPVSASSVNTRQYVGELVLIALFEGVSASTSVSAYQAAPIAIDIDFSGLTWVTDIPYSGGTATSANCSFSIIAYYDNGRQFDVTNQAVVSGELSVSASHESVRHEVGTLGLTASFNNLSKLSLVGAYQAGSPHITGITLSNLTWAIDVPSSGGTATSANCYYTIYAKYSDGSEDIITNAATVTGSSQVNSSNLDYRHSAGTLTLTAILSGFTDSGTTTIYQKADLSSYVTKPLTFKITSPGYIMWATSKSDYSKTISYSKDNGSSWTSISSTTSGATISVSSGETVMFKGDNDTFSYYDSGLYKYTNAFANSTAGFELEGNIMSLIDSTNYANLRSLENTSEGAFFNFFAACTGLTSAERLVLPATTLTNYCYQGMFLNCYSLTTAPELPATTLGICCYIDMFWQCASLTRVQELPATTLAGGCYEEMFYGCTSLTIAPYLPATTLANYCYCRMFQGCAINSIQSVLPATTLSRGCYDGMFYGCGNLEIAPELPAENLLYRSYYGMFYYCGSLKYIKCLATNKSAEDCTHLWVGNVSDSGLFVKLKDIDWGIGDAGIPYGWTVRDYEQIQLEISDLTWVTNIPASGGVASINNCSLRVIVYNSDGSTGDVTTQAVITGNQIVESSQITSAHTAGTLTLTATYESLSATSSVTIYQDAYSPLPPSPTGSSAYLTFTILSAGTINWRQRDEFSEPAVIEYSINNGSWTSISSTAGTSFNVSARDTVRFRGDWDDDWDSDYTHSMTFSGSTAYFNISGNILSLYYGDNFDVSTLPNEYGFGGLFESTNVVDAGGLVLPDGVKDGCYADLFAFCTSLTTAPALPATTLSGGCYAAMFYGCASLTTAPELPAETLVPYCYNQMFMNCNNLNYIKCLATDISATGCTENWVDNVSNSGIFLKNPNMSNWPTGDSGIPINWDVTDYSAVAGISINNLTWTTNVPASGGTATSANCSFNVIVHYSDTTTGDVTSFATISGSQNVPSSQITSAHTAGTLTLTATYSGYSSSGSVTIYQDAFAPTPPPAESYLTFDIVSGGTIKWKASDSGVRKPISYSIDGGNNWTTITSTTSGIIIYVNNGDRVLFKGDNSSYATNSSKYNSFSQSTAKFNLSGNIMSLIDSAGFATATTITDAYAFCNIFSYCSGLISAENLVLPAETLTSNCYDSMFFVCSALTTGPSSIGTSVTTMPVSACSRMFQECRSLTTAPELPATTMNDYCYNQMFTNCTGLTTAPELPATTLTEGCYSSMFQGCRSLNYIKCLATDISAQGCTWIWVADTPSTGTFVKNPSMSSWTTGSDGIPSGWTVQDAT